jgi:hypothetical protein
MPSPYFGLRALCLENHLHGKIAFCDVFWQQNPEKQLKNGHSCATEKAETSMPVFLKHGAVKNL